jgi:hypothetical protein
VRYHSEKENDDIFYEDYGRNVRIVFDDGHWITPSRDDEGNGHGVLFTTDDEHGAEVIPTIGYHN